MDRWRINIKESLLASTWPSAGVKVIRGGGIGENDDAGTLTSDPLVSAEQMPFSREGR